MDFKLKKMTKFLVTGSSGLIGSQIVKDLVEKKYDVFSCYHLEKPKFGIPVHLDISEKSNVMDVFRTIKPDIVIHLAAITDVELCEQEIELAMRINAKSTEIITKESIKYNSFLAYVSTDYVFDGKKNLAIEETIPNPLNVYGKSKLEGENIINNLSSSHAIIRTSTPFGIHSKKKNFPLWIKENLESKNKISVVTDQYTSPTYVPNLSKMIIEVCVKKISGTIHLAGATRISRYDFAKMIANKFNLDEQLLKPIQMEQMNWFAKRPIDSSLNISKAKLILDNKPQEIEYSLNHFVVKIKKKPSR